jgi:hypothetical protein
MTRIVQHGDALVMPSNRYRDAPDEHGRIKSGEHAFCRGRLQHEQNAAGATLKAHGHLEVISNVKVA